MNKKIMGVTVGTSLSPSKIEEEIKPVKTVNGRAPDENGNVEVNGAGGTDGKTPYIKNGNWWIGDTDTGVKAKGTDGKDGINGTGLYRGTVVSDEDAASSDETEIVETIDKPNGEPFIVGDMVIDKNGKIWSIFDNEGHVTLVTSTKGEKGDPYTLTDTDKTEIADEVSTRIPFVKSPEAPIFVNSTDECTDTSKVYVLPDGYIYAWQKKKVTIPHNANDGTGFKNVRPTGKSGSNKDETSTKNGLFTTAPIEVDNSWTKCVVNISGLEKIVPTFYASLYVYYFDANGTFIGYDYDTQLYNADGTRLTTGSEVDIPLPISINIASANINGEKRFSTAKFVRVTIGVHKTAAITDADIKNLVVNFEQLNVEEDVYGWYSTGHAFVPADYEERIVDLEEIVPELQEDVEQLKKVVGTSPSNSGAVWYAVGDSITKGYGVGADNCWVKYVKQYNGYDAEKSKNLGISGLGFAKSDPNYSKTARTVVDENSFAEVDLVTVAIGINDWKEPFSIDTVKSEMRYCFEKILTDNPYCKIIFIVPFNMRNKGNESTNWALGYSGSDVTGGTLQNFIDTQKSVCEEYGIQVIDMTKDSVINKKNITTLLYDGIHPDAECHKALGRELARRITFA